MCRTGAISGIDRRYQSLAHTERLLPLTTAVRIFADKITALDIDLPGKRVFVTSSALSADELLEVIRKTGKPTSYVGLKQ